MESMSLPGRVQCTHRAAERLSQQDPKIPLVRRGNLSIKGKVARSNSNLVVKYLVEASTEL